MSKPSKKPKPHFVPYAIIWVKTSNWLMAGDEADLQDKLKRYFNATDNPTVFRPESKDKELDYRAKSI